MQLIEDIDHSRLAHQAGAIMGPARVVIFSDAQLESELIALNPLIAIDLPLRALAFENLTTGRSEVIYNSFDYIASRYRLADDTTATFSERYQNAMNTALADVPASAISAFTDNRMQPDGIITIASPFDFEESLTKINSAINAQDDTVMFGHGRFSGE
ncbi:hypothetical protein BST95_15780 [Halioglobus japonicus]|uniref:DUF302 domain-containing protein n=1 Tax=Halioglobus japonicus TaxID=930805 RepID=A0AAP8SP93_9GAMM|nr:DUF302 domain-containing protein [Halioglobus japonicus]AQA19478.1 hypothetical protein BST95_15780 [Halioglobus japonicus]PLW87465.1 DUF302 domain-containing protein [Halioglobus japonicus]GHD08327.1 hypothetical protein GCM10007052_05130 [Halioglobus japonicus]